MCSSTYTFIYLISVCLPSQQKYTYEPHHCAGHMSGAAGKVAHLLTLMVTSLIWLRQLLILSGDVEVNPGPLGQHGEGKATLLLCKHTINRFKKKNCVAILLGKIEVD